MHVFNKARERATARFRAVMTFSGGLHVRARMWISVAKEYLVRQWQRANYRLSLPLALRPATGRSQGDVPGWVLITLMTAGLVVIIWSLAGPALSSVFQQAIERVTAF